MGKHHSPDEKLDEREVILATWGQMRETLMGIVLAHTVDRRGRCACGDQVGDRPRVIARHLAAKQSHAVWATLRATE